MKNTLFFLFLFFSTYTLADSPWVHYFGGEHTEVSSKILQTSDGGYVVIGHTNSYNAPMYNVMIVRYDVMGQLLWQKTIGGNSDELTTDAVQNAAGEIYITGKRGNAYAYDGMLMKVSANGDLIWTKQYGNAFDNYFNSVILSDDGNVLLSGVSRATLNAKTNVNVWKVDTNGVVIWTKDIRTFNKNSEAKCAVNDGVGGYVLGGRIEQANYSGFFMHLNNQGDSLSSAQVNLGSATYGSMESVVRTMSGDFAFTGNGSNPSFGNNFILKTDINGNTIFYHAGQSGGNGQGALGIAEMPDSGFVTIGYYASFATVPAIVRYDKNGIQLWDRRHYSVDPGYYSYNVYGRSIVVNSDLSFTFCGSYNCSTVNDGMIVHTDTAGNTTAVPTIYITSTQSNFCDSTSVNCVMHAPPGFANYEWIKKTASNVTVLPASNQDILSVTEAATYYCIASNNDIRIISNPFIITVNSASTIPVITQGSVISTCSPFYGVSISTAYSAGNNYEWTKDGVVIPNSNFYFTTGTSGVYTVRVYNSCGSNVSAPTVVNTNSQPAHMTLSDPDGGYCAATNNYNVLYGSPSTNDNNNRYYLYRNDTLINSNSTPTYITISIPGNYYLVSISTCGIDTSNVLTVSNTVAPQAATLSAPATQNTLKTHHTTVGALIYSGYQYINLAGYSGGVSSMVWYRDGVQVSTTTSTSYTADAPGNYSAKVINACGFGYTDTVYVSAEPFTDTISSRPSTSCYQIILDAPPAAVSSIQWYRSGVSILGGTSASLAVSDSGYYYCTFLTNQLSQWIISDTFHLALPLNTNSLSYTSTGVLCAGDSAVLTLSSPVGTRQWMRDGVTIPGATGQSYVAYTSGIYSVQVTQATCHDFFGNISIQIGAPRIQGQHYLCNNNSVSLHGIYSGSSFQWFKDGVLMQGETASTLTVTTPGAYHIRLTNGCGIVVSDTFQVHNSSTTPGLSGFSDIHICEGDSLSLSIPYSPDWDYRWQYNGTQFSDSSDVIIRWADFRNYGTSLHPLSLYVTSASQSCVVNNTSALLAFEPGGIREIYSTTPEHICGVSNRTLVARRAQGDTFQWYFNGTSIPGANGYSYNTSVPGIYKIAIESVFGCSYESNEIELKNDFIDGQISSSGNTTFCYGSGVNLALTTNAQSFQWFKNGVLMQGETDSVFFANESGTYTVMFSNSAGCSGEASQTVISSPAPAFSIVPIGSTTACTGDSVQMRNFSLPGSQYVPANYQWWRNGTLINGAINSRYYATTSGYYHMSVVSGDCAYTSDSILVTISSTPVAQISSARTTICTGDSLFMSSNTQTGNTYQWNRNGIAIGGATHSYFYATQTGTYTCGIQTPCGYALSNSIVLTQGSAVTSAISNTGSDTVCSGSTFTLTLVSNGSSFQWNRNGLPIAGATSSTYVGSEGGNYSCTASNSCSALTSNQIAITKIELPVVSISSSSLPLICSGNSVVLEITSFNSDNYQWLFNGVLLTGEILPTLLASTAGQYSCNGTNTCGTSSSDSINVLQGSPVSSSTSSISGSDTICAGDIGVPYSVTPVSGATYYNWNCNSLVYFSSGQGTSSVNVDFPVRFSSGLLQVQSANMCGMGQVEYLSIHTDPTCIIHPLRESSPWHSFSADVFPNPSSGQFTINISSEDPLHKYSIRLTDLTGREILFVDDILPNSDLNIGEQLPPGVYLVRIIQNADSKVIRIVKI